MKHLLWPAALVLLVCSCTSGNNTTTPANPNVAPSIVTQPASRTVTEGQTASFSVVASGNPTPTYQWRRNGSDISGAVAASYTTPATVGTDNGAQFTVVVTNAVSSVTSSPAILTVNTRPAITTPPASRTVTEGQAATFSVVATGNPAPTYQWRKNGTPITGATQDSYTTPATSLADNGALYTVALTNVVDTVVSPAATLTVQPAVIPPTITTHPSSQTVDVGGSFTLHVAASGTTPFTYQWKKDGTAIPGAISPDYAVSNAQTSHAGSYTATVANSANSATSSPAVITVRVVPPTITTQPASQTVDAGGSVTFHVAASGTTPFSYQWKKGGVAIAGATSQDYTINNVQASHAGSYTVTVANSASSATSDAAVLTVNVTSRPTITTQPASQTVATGGTASFSVEATGTTPFTYQWKKGGVDISGAIGQSYSIPNVQSSHAGNYTVVVTNSVSSAASNTAVLTVQPSVSTITGFTPTSGAAGTSVTITGTNLTGATAVRFNGTSASSFTVDSATQIRATVPSGATSGTISVTTPLGTATSSGTFTIGGSTLDLYIQNVYINQAAQNLNGTVPLIQGRDGLLRVFALASQANSATPKVKAQIFNGATEVWSATISAPGGSVPLSVDESSLANSWNATIPGAKLMPGYSLLVTLDSASEVAESNEGNNTWPSSGTSALNVVVMPTLQETIVPLKVRGTSVTDRVNSGTLSSYMDMIPRVLPVNQISPTLHAEYTSSKVPTCDGDASNDWDALLTEVTFTLWYAEGRVGNYYGLLRFDDAGYCVRGMGWEGGYPVSIGWDLNTIRSGSVSGLASETIAHELGHNFGYAHTACSGEAGPDTGYPYHSPVGTIGIWGYDLYAGVLRSPATYKDLMSYCDPQWISDYSFNKMLLWRQANASMGDSQTENDEPCLVVSGYTNGETMVIEPALTLNGRAHLPLAGDLRLAGLDAAGRELFSIPFATTRIADSRNPRAAGFLFALPHRVLDTASLTELRVTDEQQHTVSSIGRSSLMADARLAPSGLATRTGQDQASLSWNHRIYPLVMVRNPVNRQVIGLLRGGEAELATQARELELTFSDGVRSHTVTVPVME